MVYLAVLICSEDDCTERFEARGTLAELEALACDCGCGLHILGWPVPVVAASAALEFTPA